MSESDRYAFLGTDLGGGIKFKEWYAFLGIDLGGGIKFKEWPKISRLFRDCVITEKIDGTNSAIGFQSVGNPEGMDNVLGSIELEYGHIAVYAQSRSKLITPDQDNHGFAKWVSEHKHDLFQLLGLGLHFGEWWGSGIQRGYGLQKGDKRFSLFNTSRHALLNDDPDAQAIGVATVPVLYEGPFDSIAVQVMIEQLRWQGSSAAPGYDNPEGVVTFHKAANICFKTTLEKDEKPKGSNE